MARLGQMVSAAAVASILGVPSPVVAATVAQKWTAPVGTSQINGSAVARAYVSGTGALKLSLTGLVAGASYPVSVIRGTCTQPGRTLFTLPSSVVSNAGQISRTYTLNVTRVDAIRTSTSNSTGRVAVRVGTGTTTLCGTFRVTPVHRIGVRVVEGKGEFFDRWTGGTFVPRGNNLIRLATQETSYGPIYYHSTFNPSLYDHADMRSQLVRMSTDGYNVVRVFLNHCCPTDAIGDPGGLNAAYLDTVVRFLRLAKSKGLFVMFTIDGTPDDSPFAIFDETSTFEGENPRTLAPKGVTNNRRFWNAFIRGLINRNAPFDAIWSYELRNELWFHANLKPLSQTSGLVTTANGETYDMAITAEKLRMTDEGLVYFIDQVRAKIHALAPTALVSIGFFVPQAPNPLRPGDTRYIETRPAIWNSSADFIDLHAYPGWDSLEDHAENFGIDGMEGKPLVMGEFGAFESQYATRESALAALVAWQVASCALGFDGWLLWDWDQFAPYHAIGGGGEIGQALAPVTRLDPCVAE